MTNSISKGKGLSFTDIDSKWKLAINPDNVFWALMSKGANSDFTLSDNMLSLYERVKGRLTAELNNYRFKPKLTAIYIDPTDRCNANCPYCYIPSKIRKNGTQMTTEQLDYVMKKISAYFKTSKKKPVIIFHAAEPLLVKDAIFGVISKFKNEFHFGLQTNTLLLEESDVRFLKKHRVGVGISLDSIDPDINNRLRASKKGNGNFEKVMQAIEWFDGYEGLNVIATVTKHNVTGLSDLVRFLHSKRIGCALLNPIRVTQRSALELIPEQKVFARHFIDAVETAMELSRNSRHQTIIGNFANVILAIVAPTARRMMCDISPCGGGHCFLTITARGNMIPCGEFVGAEKEFSGGNIFETTISKAMNSRPFKEVRARIVERIEECSTCDFRNLCGSPCPAELHIRGNMYQKAVFCEFYKDIIRYTFKIIADDKVKYLLRKDAMGGLRYEYRYINEK